MAKQVRRLVTSAVLIPLVVMAALSGLLAWEVRLLMIEAAWVDHTDQVMSQANRTQKLLLDMETGTRGYLLTRDARFLEPYRTGSDQALPAIARLIALVADDATQTARAKRVRELFSEWRALADAAVTQPPPADTTSAPQRKVMLARYEGMAQMRAVLTEMLEGEEQRRAARESAVQRATTLTGVTALAVLVLVAALLLLVTRRNLMHVAERFEVALDGERAARASAEEALRVRESFLHMASHELKTPLTSLQLQIESILRQLAKLDAPAAGVGRLEGKGRAALRQLARLQELIAALLDVQRLAATGTEPVVTDMDALVAMRDAVSQLEQEIRDAGCALTIDAPHSLFVRADPMRLGQVLTNLLTNAVKYGRGKPIEITLEATDSRCIFRVRDHGIGISAEDQVRIFERFERAVSPEHFHGFGLGLWIVKSLVEKMGGTVRVESTLGDGSTFIVDLARGEGDPLDVTGEHMRRGVSAKIRHAPKHERPH